MIGSTISHYRIIGKLGEGGMGEVYKAEDTKLGRIVALKFLAPSLRSDPEARKRFNYEARAASALDHENICTIHDIDETTDGRLFIVMAFCDGETLKDRIDKRRLETDEALDIAVQVLQGLAKAHEHGIIHRDIKPANIIVTTDGGAKIVDFGLAKLSDRTVLTRTSSTLGTVAYMSPEQSIGNEVDARSDVWSMGVILYELLTGRRPFKGDHEPAVLYLINNAEPEPLASLAPGISPQLARVVHRALEKDPGSRHASAAELLADLKAARGTTPSAGHATRGWPWLAIGHLKRPIVAIPSAIGALMVILGISWFFEHQSNVRWAREVVLPNAEAMVEENDVWRNLVPAYRLAEQAEAILGDDPRLSEVFAKCGLHIGLNTEPAGGRVFMKAYSEPESDWQFVGITPLDSVRVPIGIFRWKIEKEGYRTVYAAASTWRNARRWDEESMPAYDIHRTLDKEEEIPTAMVRVPETDTPVGRLADFFIDTYEVTNRQYKSFVDAGAYRKKEFWKHDFIKDGKQASWEEAMRLFVDQTDQHGPSTWHGGDFPPGQAEYPVAGVSWYEAAAFAEYVKKSLPTDVHWNAARGGYTPMVRLPQLGGIATLVPFSNIGGSGPVAVGSLPGITAYGAYDMAGNVREWCWNETPKGRIIRGGGWSDNTYEFSNRRQLPPMDRSPTNGFRCALYPDQDSVPKTAYAPIPLGAPVDFRDRTSVSDAILRVYQDLFAYDAKELNVRLESREESPDGWIREDVSYDAAYGGERVLAHLFIPSNATPPYQTVIYVPGSGVVGTESSQNIQQYYEYPLFLSFLVRSGRAVLFPVYKGTFERGNPQLRQLHRRSESHAHTELLIQQVKDFRRSVDYLKSRADIDGEKLAYFGMSWGAELGAMIPAIEERLAVCVLVAGGLSGPVRPEVDRFNYTRRVTIPTLMLNGKYDSIFDLDMCVRPMFDMLGTPNEHKRLILYETDHLPPRTEYVKETLMWLDRYLGSTK